MPNEMREQHSEAEVGRQQLVAILASGMKRYCLSRKLGNIPPDYSGTCLEIPAKTRLSVSHHVNTTVGRNAQEVDGQRPES